MKKAKTSKFEIAALDFRKLLTETYEAKAKRRPSYSFRAYARDLGMDTSSLRKIVSGRRPLGVKVITALGEKLGLSANEIERYLKSQKERKKLKTLNSDPIKPKYVVLDETALSVLSSWKSYALLELIELDRFVANASWIAQALHIEVAEVNRMVETFVQLKWIEVLPNGRWKTGLGNTSTDPLDPKTMRLRKTLMKGIFENAAQAYSVVPSEKASFQAQTFCIDEDLLPEAVEKIRAFRTEMNHLLQKGGKKPNQVYQLCVGLFPLSHIDNLSENDPDGIT